MIELTKNYGIVEWREDLKTYLNKTGLEGANLVFLFPDTQVMISSYLLLR